MAKRGRIIAAMVGGFLAIFAILYLFPYIWMTSMSFKPDSEIYSPTVFPQEPTLEQYQRLFYGYKFKEITLKIDFPAYYKNTIIITVISLFLIIFTASITAY